MSTAAAVSVVYVTKDRCADLMLSLERLAELVPPPAEILVVDNASEDDTLARLASEGPAVKVLPQSHNLGVAAARTLGIEAADHELVVCIDDDARLETLDGLDRVSEHFRASQQLALVAFRIVNASRGVTLGHEFPRRRLSPEAVAREQDVAYFVGCGFALRRSVFLELGGFCSLIQYGLEELDLSYRLLEAGHRLLYDPTLVVSHRADPEARRGDAWHYNLMRSRVLVVLRNLPLWAALPHLVVWHVGMLAHGLLRGHTPAVLAGARAGWRLAPEAWRERRPISLATARRVLRLAGRLFW
jgi:GT2 family glycosyltransferase